jgi:PAS domain S-box-containing protein
VKPAPLPPDEAERLQALRGYGILDTLPEQAYDDLTHLASQICGTPIALITLIDAERQWFKSRVGLDVPETHRDIAVCAHAIHETEVFVVPDALEDERFADNSAMRELHIRFYAGAPLITPAGHALGTICVMDREPRQLDDAQIDALKALARQTMAQMELRRRLTQVQQLAGERAEAEQRAADRAMRIARYQSALSEMARLDKSDRKVALGRIATLDARALRVARVGIWLFNEDQSQITCCELCEGGVARGGGSVLDAERYPRYFAAMKERRVIAAMDAVLDPRTSEFADDYLVPLGIMSMLDVPIWREGEVVGIVCHEHTGTRRVWTQEEQEFAASIADMVALVLEGTDRRNAEQALRAAQQDLEARVAQRTAELARTNDALQTEIAERRRMEEALQRSEEHFRLLIERSSDIASILGPDGAMLYQSPSIERVLGYTPDELLGKSTFEFIHPEDVEGTLEAFRDMLESPGEPRTVELRYRHKDGSWRVVESYGRTLLPDSASAGVVVNARDITERKRAEEELRLQKTLLEAQGEASIDGVLVVAPNGGILSYNRRFGEMWGIPQEIVEGGSDDDAIRTVLDKLSDPNAFVARVQSLYEQPEIEARDEIRLKDGRVFDRYTAPIRSEDGAYYGRIWWFRDMTDRKRAEEALRRAKAEAEQSREIAERANRAKSEFLSRMSHELRTPMNSILGFAQVLARKELPLDQRKAVDHILRAGRHLLNLINEVLDISRIEANRQAMSLEPVRVNDVVQETLSLIRPLAAQRGCRIDEPAAVDETWHVQADRQRLAQVLLNLLSNAAKYNRPGGTIAVGGEADERTVRIHVHDTGPGIPEDKLEQVFVPFERLGAEQSDVEGTGLGLALSRRLVDAMGGALSVTSTVGKGSTFTVVLPRTDAASVNGGGAVHVLTEGTAGANGGPATLLYIEDNLANLTLIETILANRPEITLMSALQGQLGLDLAWEHRPDVILLDLNLPDLPGDEVLARLRSDERTRETPVIVISADATHGRSDSLLGGGAQAYLTKPLDVEQFLGTIDRLLRA